MPSKPSTPTLAPLYYGSVCSGIEAVSLAWQPLGFTPAWFAEIAPFPCALLCHHYPDVPNLGDMTQIASLVHAGTAPAPDLLVGGTPCQSFSIAGDRRGLDDPRGALTLSYVELANAIDQVRLKKRRPPATLVWENVLGVLSDKSNAFGCLLGALAGEDGELQPAGKRWTDAGCVYGPQRTIAWRVLDAQYFGLAQRRRRVFLVASARKGFDPAAVLFERDGVRRDSPPSRQPKEDVTGTISARTQGGGGLGTDFECDGGLIASTGNISHCLNAGSMRRQDVETVIVQRGVTLHGTHPSVQTVASYADVAQCLRARTPGNIDNSPTTVVQCITGDVTHTLKADGFDGSEDGTGRGTPIICYAANAYQAGKFEECDLSLLLTTSADRSRAAPILAFSCKDHGADATGNLAPTLRAMNHCASHANAGGQMAVVYAIQAGALRENLTSGPEGAGVRESIAYRMEARADVQALAFVQNSRSEVRFVDGDGGIAGALAADTGVQQQNYIAQQYAVRRLMAIECERLQGIPDDYTRVPYRGKPAADAPRYKAIGNSMAVPCVAWLGERLRQALMQKPVTTVCR